MDSNNSGLSGNYLAVDTVVYSSLIFCMRDISLIVKYIVLVFRLYMFIFQTLGVFQIQVII